MSDRLRTALGPLDLSAPLLTAAGCAGTGRELAAFFELSKLGAFVTPSVTLRPRAGRPTPRVTEAPSALLTAMGLPGPGIEGFLDRDLPWLAEQDVPVVVSIAGDSAEEFGELAARLRGAPGVAAIEVNVACPNVEDRGRMFSRHPRSAASVVRAARAGAAPGTPVLAKLAPDAADLANVALACVDAGADGLTLINTVEGTAIDTTTLRPTLTGVSGGLSGPAIRPIALRCVYQVHAALPDVPIVGVGGVTSGLDALEFLLAGASAVGVGTTLFHDPGAVPRILRELDEALAARRLGRVADAVGLAHKPAGYAPPLAGIDVPPPAAPAEPAGELKETLP